MVGQSVRQSVRDRIISRKGTITIESRSESRLVERKTLKGQAEEMSTRRKIDEYGGVEDLIVLEPTSIN